MPRLFLTNGRAVHRITAWGNVINFDADHIAAAQLAIDRESEEREIAFAAFNLELRSNGPNVFRPELWLGADQLTFVPGLPIGAWIEKVSLVIQGHTPLLQRQTSMNLDEPSR